MRSKKQQRQKHKIESKGRGSEVTEAPGFLERMVGKARAKTLCRDVIANPRRD